MISVILALCAAIASFSSYTSFQPTDIQGNNFTFMFSLLPVIALGGLGGLFSLIGALLILVGGKEYGEQHRKFVMYALMVFIIVVVIEIIFTVTTVMTVYTWALSGISTSTTTLSVNAFQTFMTLSIVNSLITGILTGLMWIFALYHLENKKGRAVLIAAFIMMILTAGIITINTTRMVNDWINQGTLNNLFNQSTTSSSVYSQLISSSPWAGSTGIILLVSELIQSILLFVALYIPYQRIKTGDLQPILPPGQGQKRCPTCGRQIPNDAINCPYCGTQL